MSVQQTLFTGCVLFGIKRITQICTFLPSTELCYGSRELLKFDKVILSLVMKTDTLDSLSLKQSATLIPSESRALRGCAVLFHSSRQIYISFLPSISPALSSPLPPVVFMSVFLPGSPLLISRLMMTDRFKAQSRCTLSQCSADARASKLLIPS